MNKRHPSPIIVKDVHELLRSLGPGISNRSRLIAIDGVGGAGKSALGAQLAVALDNSIQVDLDHFLIEKQDSFFGALRLDALKEALMAPERQVIVTGICMLRVLAAIERCPDVLIYIKRMAKWGWADEDEIDCDELGRTAASLGVTVQEWPVQGEVCDYHRAYLPHERATIILERMETR
jgi:uridine kinase